TSAIDRRWARRAPPRPSNRRQRMRRRNRLRPSNLSSPRQRARISKSQHPPRSCRLNRSPSSRARKCPYRNVPQGPRMKSRRQNPAEKPEQRQQQTAQAAPRWKPTGLAPADIPSISLTQGQPKRLDAGGYSSKIWSALARKKPNAGELGSTTVTFAVGPAGA